MKRLLISGWEGRMGREVAAHAAEYGFSAAPFAPGAPGDAVVDFSHPDALEALLAGTLPLVIGTTGYDDAQRARIAEAAQRRPILVSANFSPGMYALGQAAELLRGLLPEWDISLIERHHAGKRDAPSGTALRLAETLGIPKEAILSVRGGTVPGIHELTLYGPGERLTLCHTAEGRGVFARGALAAARWLLGQGTGLYGMAEWMKK